MICELLCYFCLLRSELLLTFWWVDDDSGTLLLGHLAGKFLKDETFQLNDTLPKTNSLLWKMVVGKVLSFGFRPISEAMSILGTGMFIVQPQLNYTVELQVEMNGRNSVSWKLGELSMKKKPLPLGVFM